MLKLTLGGGVTQFSKEQLQATVSAAEDRGTYICVHAYTSTSIKRAINAGVKVIEYSQLMDEKTAKYIADRGIWIFTQVFLNDQDATPCPKGIPAYHKQIEITTGTAKMFPLLKKYNVKTAWGTDIIFDPKLAKRHGAQIVKWQKWYTPYEALRLVTATNGELLRLSGSGNPYPGFIGVVREGAYADMLPADAIH